MRERQAVARRPADELLAPAVTETLKSLDLGAEHAGAVQLARRYAKVIDEARDQSWAMRWVAPELLKVLEQLQATPSTRPKAPPERGPNQLDRLRAVRRGGPGAL